jgi:hypothetical protein
MIFIHPNWLDVLFWAEVREAERRLYESGQRAKAKRKKEAGNE